MKLSACILPLRFASCLLSVFSCIGASAQAALSADDTVGRAAPPEMPKFGKPGEVIHSAAVALRHPKKSADREQGRANHVFFTLWIPEGLKAVRGLYHTPFNLDTVEKEQSRAMARHWGFALVGGNFMRVQNDELAPAPPAGLRELAGKSGHAEIAGAPMILSSMSAADALRRRTGPGLAVKHAALDSPPVAFDPPYLYEVDPTMKARMVQVLRLDPRPVETKGPLQASDWVSNDAFAPDGKMSVTAGDLTVGVEIITTPSPPPAEVRRSGAFWPVAGCHRRW